MKYLATIAAVTCLFLSGCGTVNTVGSATSAPTGSVSDRRIVIDENLQGSLGIGPINGTTVSGLMRISTNLSNNLSGTLDIAYKVEWFDKDGILLPSVIGGWKKVHFEGGEKIAFSEIATNAKAVDFRIKFIQN